MDTIELGLDTFGDLTADANGQPLPHAQVLRDVVEEAVLADQLGLAFIGLGEHHRRDFSISAPEVLGAAIAGRTSRIHIGSSVTVLSSDDPVRVYERFSTLNAVSNGQNSFVTASHCTTTQGGVEGTQYWQSLSSQPNSFIGTEVADPVYVRGKGHGSACPKNRRCRMSDAARAAYAAGVPFTLGGIAQTSGPNNGSLTITGTFAINGEGGEIAGDIANKVGRTTGWTQGVITNTCVNTGVSGSNIVQLCQTFVSAGVGGGDSGSDVFQVTSSTNVKLAGILWGGNSNGTQFVFSPLANVMVDLGTLTTH